MRARYLRWFAAITIVVASARIGSAQLPTDHLDDAIQRADTIVLARCTATNSHWDEQSHVIVTDVSLRVERSFKGSETEVVTVRTLGGQVGATGMGASHARIFPRNARVVALLRRSRFGSYHVVASAAVGPLIVSADGTRVRVGADLVDLDELAQRLAPAAP